MFPPEVQGFELPSRCRGDGEYIMGMINKPEVSRRRAEAALWRAAKAEGLPHSPRRYRAVRAVGGPEAFWSAPGLWRFGATRVAQRRGRRLTGV